MDHPAPPAPPAPPTIHLPDVQQQIVEQLRAAEEALRNAEIRVWILKGQLDLVAQLAQLAQQPAEPA
jgi:hypothetical protein